MIELDEIWNQMIADATDNRHLLQGDIADYLELKAANDELRTKAIAWLFDSLDEIVAEAERRNIPLATERDDPHSFEFRGANIVGPRLRIHQGVRALTLEAGWPRTPSDGFMRGNALAVARIVHFGMKESDANLSLVRFEGVPRWFAEAGVMREEFRFENLIRHFATFIGGG